MSQKHYLALLHKLWISQKKLHTIFSDNSDYELFYNQLSSELLFKYDYNQRQIDYILSEKDKIKIEYIKYKLFERNVEIITINEKKYPESFRQIANPPYLIYLRWKIDSSPKFAVVWSRKITSYWQKAIEKIVSDISKYFTIVSWWATWCDTKAHEITLLNRNNTLSIIWTWIDVDYPVSNKKLYDSIVEKWWWVVSIFPIWEVWNSYNFPIRNELVAWISSWVLVVEAKIKSGTLITSNMALDMWKDLFAIPGDFFRINSEWCNELIKKWVAKLVTCSEDILCEYNISSKDINYNKHKLTFEDDLEKQLYDALILDWYSVDNLSKKFWIDVSVVWYKLSMLEIKKLIKKSQWWNYEVF